MGRDHLMNEARARPYQDQRTCYPWHRLPGQQGRLKGKGRPDTFEGPSLPLIFLFLPYVIPAPPRSIKGRAEHPAKGTDQFDKPRTTLHTAEQQPSSQYSFDLSIRDLGPVPLSTIYTAYYEPFSVLITRAAADWT